MKLNIKEDLNKTMLYKTICEKSYLLEDITLSLLGAYRFGNMKFPELSGPYN